MGGSATRWSTTKPEFPNLFPFHAPNPFSVNPLMSEFGARPVELMQRVRNPGKYTNMPFFKPFHAILDDIVMLGPCSRWKPRRARAINTSPRAGPMRKRGWGAARWRRMKRRFRGPWRKLTYQMAAQKARFETSAMHISTASKIRAQASSGRKRSLEFQKGLCPQPPPPRRGTEILRNRGNDPARTPRVEQDGTEAPPEVRGMTPSEMARKDTDDRITGCCRLTE